jgi:hypothetical protein
MHLLLQALLASLFVVAPLVLIDMRRGGVTQGLRGCVGLGFFWPAFALVCGLLFGAAEQEWATPVLGFAGPWRAPVVGAATFGLLHVVQLLTPLRPRGKGYGKLTIEPILIPLIFIIVGGAIGLVWIGAGRLLDLAGL